MLTEKDINIFTIVKDKNNISPLRQWCIDSWHKRMPNANIMIFDDSDLNNPNWKYYDVIKNDKLWNFYKTHKQFQDKPTNYSPISTDSIRIRLLKAIPNALYMDSDAYLNITGKEFLELCNKYKECDICLNDDVYGYSIIKKDEFNNDGFEGGFTFTGYFAGAKNIFLDKMIKYYDTAIEINNSHKLILNIKRYFNNNYNCGLEGDREEIYNFLKNTEYLKDYDNIKFTRKIITNKHCLSHLALSSFECAKGFIPDLIKFNSNKEIDILYCKVHGLWYDEKKYKEKYLQNIKNTIFSFIFCKKDEKENVIILCNEKFISSFHIPYSSLVHEKIIEYVIKPIYHDYTFNYYEIPNLGDDPCLLKKI